jgi:vancomycin aglycone glucosyltransferase
MPKPAEMGVISNAWGVSSCGSRGGVEPMAGLAVKLRTLGAEVWVCAPPDCAELLGRIGVPLVPMGVWR